MKKCTKCLEMKDLILFPIATKMTLGRSSWCRTCLNEYKRKDYQKNKSREAAKNKKWRLDNLDLAKSRQKTWLAKNPDYSKGKLLQKYWPDVTWQTALANFKQLQVTQNNTCKICKNPETKQYKNTAKIQDLCVDHCHTTGIVRGLLCDDCNVLVGRAKDSYQTCEQAAVYLKVFNATISSAN